MLCFVLINTAILNLLCVWIMTATAFIMCGGSEFRIEGQKWDEARSPFDYYIFLYLQNGSFSCSADSVCACARVSVDVSFSFFSFFMAML